MQDLDISPRDLTMPNGKGSKDRRTLLPERVAEQLRSHLLGRGQDIRTIQERLGYSDLKTALVYVHC